MVIVTMKKIEIENSVAPFPKPAVLVGALVDGHPNFMNLAWLTRISMKPHLWLISIGKGKHTVSGIRENGKFSINIANANILAELDYCGLVSGEDVDKSKLFTVFYGNLKDVPMIEESPVNFELVVYEIRDFLDRVLIIGEVKHVYTEERYLGNGRLDQEKVNQVVFTQPPGCYWSLGGKLGDAWSIGKKLQPNNEKK